MTFPRNTELEDTVYRHLTDLLPPGRAPVEGGTADGIVKLIAGGEADNIQHFLALILDWFATRASESALLEIGAARGLQRYSGEYLEAYRNRVVNAYEFWEKAGTVPGMLAALEHMGYGIRLSGLKGNVAQGIFPAGSENGVVLTQAAGDPVQASTYTLEIDGEVFELPTLLVPDNYRYYELPPTRIIEHYHEDRNIWAEFSLFLTPSDPSLNADAWDDGSRWDDGSLWDLTIRQDELNRIRAVVDEIKPAHARLRGIYLVSQWGMDYWDDGLNWDDGTIWDASKPTTLYLREGA